MSADEDPSVRPATGSEGSAAEDRVVRRALRACGWTTLVLSVITVLANAAFGGDGVAAGIWITSSIVVGLLVGAGWLVLSAILDMSAGVVPSRRRIVWTAGMFVAAFISPVLPAAMLQVAAEQGGGGL